MAETTELGKLMTTFGADLGPLIGSVNKVIGEFTKIQNAANEAMGNVEKKTKTASEAMSMLNDVAKKLAATFAVYKLTEAVKEVTLLSARYETMGVVLGQMAKTANSSYSEMSKLQKELMATGISAIESRESLSKLIQAHVNLSDATKLARIAQDAAVIGNMNSSEAFSRLVYGIQSAQIEVLRTIGINVNFEQSYMKLAKQLGKTTNDLTGMEKTQARVNAIFEQGNTIAGVYEAAMGTAGKQLNSMKRYIQDIQVSIGDAFLPAFTEIVTRLTDTFKEIQKWLKDNKDNIAIWGDSLRNTMANVIDVMSTVVPIVADVTAKFAILYGSVQLITFLQTLSATTWEVDAAWTALNATMKANIVIGGSLLVGGLIDWLITAYDNTKQLEKQFDSMESRVEVLQRTADKGHIELLDQKKIVEDIRFLERFQTTLKQEMKDVSDVVKKQPFDTEYVQKLKFIEDELKIVTGLLDQFKNALLNVRTPNIGSFGGGENALSPLRQQLIAAGKLGEMNDPFLKLRKNLEDYEKQLKSTEGNVYDVAMQAGKVELANSWIDDLVAKRRSELTSAGKDAQKEIEQAQKEAQKKAEEYANSLEKITDEYNKLTMKAVDYSKLQVWREWEKEAAKMSDYALATRDMKLAAIDLKDQLDKLKETTLKNIAEKPQNYANTDWFVGMPAANKRAEDLTIDFEEKNNYLIKLSENTAKQMEKNFSSFYFDTITGKLTNLADFWASVLNSLAKMTSDILGQMTREMIFGVKTGETSLFSQISGAFGSLFSSSAQGNAFAGPGISAYSNTVVTQPTFFPFAKGIGLMGEKGFPGEAIMPLTRTKSGDLGVRTTGEGSSAPNIKFEVHNHGLPQTYEQKDIRFNGEAWVCSVIAKDMVTDQYGTATRMGLR